LPPRLKAVLLILGIVALVFLVGCGGGGESGTAAAGSGETGAVAASPGAQGGGDADSARKPDPASAGGAEPRSAEAPVQRKQREARERRAYEKKRHGEPSAQSAPFARYSGKGKAHLHLAEFGSEADAGERSEVESLVEKYFAAGAAAEWARACEYLSPQVSAQLEALARQEDDATGEGCAEELAGVLRAFGKAMGEGAMSAPEGITSLRTEVGGRAGEGAGFALFHGSDGSDHWMAVKREDGAWKIFSTAPQPFG
jgi:hypothetical protein